MPTPSVSSYTVSLSFSGGDDSTTPAGAGALHRSPWSMSGRARGWKIAKASMNPSKMSLCLPSSHRSNSIALPLRLPARAHSGSRPCFRCVRLPHARSSMSSFASQGSSTSSGSPILAHALREQLLPRKHAPRRSATTHPTHLPPHIHHLARDRPQRAYLSSRPQRQPKTVPPSSRKAPPPSAPPHPPAHPSRP
jgi:hypothetical protein